MRQLKIIKSITNRESASLEKYLQEIGRQDLLSAEEEVELAQRIHQGDQAALDRLVTANLRFVVSVAKQYQNQGVSLSDLINEGNMGLIKAAQNIAEDSNLVRVPQNQVGLANRANKAQSRFEQLNERRASVEELAEELKLPVNKVNETLKTTYRSVSVDAPFAEGEDNSLLDVLPNNDSPMADSTVNQESLAREVARVLEHLNPRERDVVKLFYGIGGQELSLEEIGDKFDLSRERVRQIKERAIRSLRNKSQLLRPYLG